MSIRVQLVSDAPPGQVNRPKIRVTLDGQPLTPFQLPPLLAPKAPEPLPPKVKAFWDYDEDAHRASRPWRYMENPNEQAVREQAERDGAWTG
jgi:hypothetical protein